MLVSQRLPVSALWMTVSAIFSSHLFPTYDDNNIASKKPRNFAHISRDYKFSLLTYSPH